MIQYLMIAEKKSIAEEIGGFLTKRFDLKIFTESDMGKWPRYHSLKGDDFNIFITWASGHLLTLKEPDELDEINKKWFFEQLPFTCKTEKKIIVSQGILSRDKTNKVSFVKNDTNKNAEAISLIDKLSKKSSIIIHAGDSGREGQLIIDEILEFIKNKKPVHRLWLNGNTYEEFLSAWDNIKDNSFYSGYYHSGLAREQADWYVGMNYSRAMTITERYLRPTQKNKDGSWQKSVTLSVGRLQTPVLFMIFKRELDRNNFKSISHYKISATTKYNGDAFDFNLVNNSELYSGYLNSENLFTNPKIIDLLNNDLIPGYKLTITEKRLNTVKRKNPLPHNTPSLQSTMSKRLRVPVGRIQEILQNLYESKMTSYPRTDCAYYTDEQFNQAGELFTMLAEFPIFEQFIIPENEFVKSHVYNVKETAKAEHFGLRPVIPSLDEYKKLDDEHKEVFHEICKRFIQSVYPLKIDETLSLAISDNTHAFQKKFTANLEKGWDIFKNDQRDDNGEDSEEEQYSNIDALRECEIGEKLEFIKLNFNSAQTKPLPLFTQSSLVEALTSVWKYIDEENIQLNDMKVYQEILKSKHGIGTSATRHTILDFLENKHYIKTNNKMVVTATELGIAEIHLIQEMGLNALLSPISTAQMEEKLTLIEQDSYSVDEFIKETLSQIKIDIDIIKEFAEKNKKWN